MNDWKQDLAILSDLSANIFAVFILVLIMLLQEAQQLPAPPQPPSVIEVTSDLAAVERVPLPAASVIAHLFERRTSAEGVSVDLFADRIMIVHRGEEVLLTGAGQSMTARLAGLLQPAPLALPVRLYVFDSRSYAAVTDLLARTGRSWREVSVPAALRKTPGGEAWSDAFVQLTARPLDMPRFRLALARLLEGAGEGLSAPAGRGAGAVQAAPSMVEGLTRLAARLGTILAAVMIVTAVVVVALIEWRWPRSRQFLRRS